MGTQSANLNQINMASRPHAYMLFIFYHLSVFILHILLILHYGKANHSSWLSVYLPPSLFTPTTLFWPPCVCIFIRFIATRLCECSKLNPCKPQHFNQQDSWAYLRKKYSQAACAQRQRVVCWVLPGASETAEKWQIKPLNCVVVIGQTVV